MTCLFSRSCCEKTKELRQFLVKTMQRIEKGEITANDGRNIIGCMNQINLSITAELKARKMAMEAGEKILPFGDMQICD